MSLASTFDTKQRGWIRSDEWFNYAVDVRGLESGRSITFVNEVQDPMKQFFDCDLRLTKSVAEGYGQIVCCLFRKQSRAD